MAFGAPQTQIIAVLFVETLSIVYLMQFDTVLTVIQEFVKLKILTQFDDFFLEPYKTSIFAKMIGHNLKVDEFRKNKVHIT